jgi:hypothetical protein
MTIKICLCQQITPSEDIDRSSPLIQAAAAVTPYVSYAGLTFVRRNSAAIRDQHGASLQVRSLTRGGLFPGRGRHLGDLEK